jgi:soluble cytochrome b562
MFRKRHLIMLAPDVGAGASEGDGGGAPAGNAAGTNQGNEAAGSTPPADPPATPSAEELQSNMLKDLGVDSMDDLKAVLKAKADADAANHTDLENAQSNLEKANKNITTQTARAENAEAQLAAYKEGVAADHIDDALALARVDLANKRDGAKTIEDALKGVLTRNPAFKGGESATNPDGTAVDDDNATGGGVPDKNDILAQVKELNKFRIIH